MKKLQVAKQM